MVTSKFILFIYESSIYKTTIYMKKVNLSFKKLDYTILSTDHHYGYQCVSGGDM